MVGIPATKVGDATKGGFQPYAVTDKDKDNDTN